MKRSNLLFTLLLAVLFLGPLFMWLFYTCADKKSYTRIPGIYPRSGYFSVGHFFMFRTYGY